MTQWWHFLNKRLTNHNYFFAIDSVKLPFIGCDLSSAMQLNSDCSWKKFSLIFKEVCEIQMRHMINENDDSTLLFKNDQGRHKTWRRGYTNSKHFWRWSGNLILQSGKKKKKNHKNISFILCPFMLACLFLWTFWDIF